jgi:hypothetical protein
MTKCSSEDDYNFENIYLIFIKADPICPPFFLTKPTDNLYTRPSGKYILPIPPT